MRKIHFSFLFAASVLAAASILFQGTEISAQGEPAFGIQKFQEKKEAPSFSLKTLNGAQVSPGDLKGRPTMLTFWASWCGSCRDELPIIDKFAIGKKDQLNIFTVVIDGEREKRVKRYVDGWKFTLPVILDVKEKNARNYGVKMLPTTFLIDPNGFILGMIVGERDWTSPEAWPAIKEVLSLR